MAVTRYKFFDQVWNNDYQHNQIGFPNVSLYSLFSSLDSITYSVPLTRAYRPDLIAFDFYGDASLAWVLIYANGFHNSPADFAPTKNIQVPRFDRVMATI